jgi:hypothetical protein
MVAKSAEILKNQTIPAFHLLNKSKKLNRCHNLGTVLSLPTMGATMQWLWE